MLLLKLFFVLTILSPAAAAAAEAGLDEASLRMKMVEEQIERRGVTDAQVLEAIRKVPRHLFIPEALRASAYQDHPVPLGWGQTISQPYIVALMTQLLEIRRGDKVLEIGTGSGYQAAVLAELGARVYSIEIIPELASVAKGNLKRAGHPKIKLKVGDGYLGWKEFAPFDAVIVTCAPEDIPSPLVEQLREGGRMVIPVGKEDQAQELVLAEKRGRQMVRRSILPVRFVPMLREDPKTRD
ncbi:MAG: protein-L-isoaspartate O-methyltransferase [Elusimicrobia bacterium RIFCSPLOWO2_01_FULL_60_11]|nr:MAG: protein-L-isoaspartate O-methyltransferase [Elusimicrobia bacterium RIFCSPLOWO2_01_FULL_60_11]